MKKGKAAKSVLSYFMNQKDISPAEKSNIKCLVEQEVINQIIGNVKIQGIGIQKIQQNNKMVKKLQKREKQR